MDTIASPSARAATTLLTQKAFSRKERKERKERQEEIECEDRQPVHRKHP